MIFSDSDKLSGTILIAEDDFGQLELLRLVLKAEFKNIEIIGVNSGVEALAQAREIVPDLVISDLYIPGMSGINLCKSLKNDVETRHIPFLLLSAHANEKTRIASLQAGAEDFLEKPLNTTDILHRVGKVISRKRTITSHHDPTSLNTISPEKDTRDAIRKKITSIHDNSVKILEGEAIWKLTSDEIDLIRDMKQGCCDLLDLCNV